MMIENPVKIFCRAFLKHSRMLRRVLLLLVCFPGLICAQSTPYLSNTKTIYSDDKVYTSVSKTTVNASLNTANKVLDKFIDDLIKNPKSLFNTIFEGLGKQSSGKDLVLIEYKDYHYDKNTGLYTGTLNVLIGSVKLMNIDFTGKITKKNISEKISEAIFELVEINSIVKIANGSILVKKLNDQTIEITQTANVKFGWFFNMFFTLNTYKSTAEWRLDKFLQNIKREIVKTEEEQTKINKK